MSTIIVELLSDLCAATGTGFSSFVDTDVSYDRWGLPFIPGRRLKGCLREAAEYIEEDEKLITRLFGERGRGEPGALKISNGHLMQADQIHRYLEQCRDAGKAVLPQTVLNMFTHVRASTSIEPETGVARDETLRYTRVVNQKRPGLPTDGRAENLTFIFLCEDDNFPDTIDAMKRICKALRNLGANRTRGLGAVVCRYEPGKTKYTAAKVADGSAEAGKNGLKRIKLHLKLQDPLLITALSGEESSNYVSGAAVLGAFSSLYIREHRKPGEAFEADETFERLFLSGNVTYSNLYISDAAGTECIPAPYFIRMLKSPESTVDGQTLTFYDAKEELIKKWAGEGKKPDQLREISRLAQPKPLRGKMLSRLALMNHEITEYRVLTERAYHHSVHNSDRSAIWEKPEASGSINDASMYTQTCIEAGQYLYGTVEGPEDLLKILAQLIEAHPLRLGMSRSAQYSRCTLVREKLELVAPEEPERIHIAKNGRLVIALESDFIPGTQDRVIDSIVQSVLPDKEYETDMGQTAMDYHMIHGYHAKRNLRNIPLQAAVMGSVITVRVPAGYKGESVLRKGRRCAEGFGVIRLYSPEMLTDFRVKKEQLAGVSTDRENAAAPEWFMHALELTEGSAAIVAARELFDSYKKKFNEGNISLSLVGRLMLMAEESETVEQLAARIDSIQKDEKRKNCSGLLQAVREKTLLQNGQETTAEKAGLWKECWMAVLRLARYYLKGR